MNNLALSESTSVGEIVATLEGTDADDGPVHFGLYGTDRFKVDKDTGQVTLVQSLDHEVGFNYLHKYIDFQFCNAYYNFFFIGQRYPYVLCYHRRYRQE